MPLSEYDLLDTNRDLETLSLAFRLYLRSCMAELGFPYSAAAVDDLDRVVVDRQYGQWHEAGARVYGFGFEPSRVDAAIEQDLAAWGEEWNEATLTCGNAAADDPQVSEFWPSNDQLLTSLVPTLRTQAYQWASGDPAWQEARERWWECLRGQGLDPLTGANDWGTEQRGGAVVGPDGKVEWSEESIRIAHLQASCNMTTGLAQTLADLEASYQAPLIVRHQDALNEWKADKQRRLAAARDYIARHG